MMGRLLKRAVLLIIIMRIIATFMIMTLAFPVAGATTSLVDPFAAKPKFPGRDVNLADCGGMCA